MTFEDISTCAYRAGTFNGDLAKELGGSNVGGVRSLRRALGKLCDLGVIQIVGRRPHRYRLDPLFVREGAEHNEERIAILCRILMDEPAMTPGGPNPLKAPRH